VLSITVPDSADLGTAAPGRSISTALGIVEVTDNRASPVDWTATVSSTDFTTGDGTAPETIPVADVEYLISGFTDTTGSATLTPASVTVMSGSSQDVVAATNVVEDNSANWNPQIQISVPDGAIDGDYTATITQSVS
jgi:WxL domain surface cell wall-binding